MPEIIKCVITPTLQTSEAYDEREGWSNSGARKSSPISRLLLIPAALLPPPPCRR